MKNEDSFVLEFIKLYYGNGSMEDLNYYLSKSDLSKITSELKRNGVIGFFYDAIFSRKIILNLPDYMLKEWKAASAKIVMQNMFYESEGSKIFKDLGERNIKCILLKGLSFMDKLYGNTTTRPISDLDILTNDEDYPRLKSYLLEQGFKYYITDDFIIGSEQEFVEARESCCNEVHFFREFAAGVLNIDVHWDVRGFVEGSPLISLFPVDNYPWLNNIENTIVGNNNVNCLNLEMQLVHSVFHLALNHQFTGIKWFLDICQIVSKYRDELDWAFIKKLVIEPNCRKVFGVTLSIVSDLIGDPVIHNYSKEFWAGKGMPGEYSFYKQRLLSGKSRVEKYICFILLADKIKDKFKIISFILFRPDAIPAVKTSKNKSAIRVFLPIYILYRAIQETIYRVYKKENK